MEWRHKIADVGRMPKPFDGFGIFNGVPVYWESKNLKKPQSFNFKRLEDHQIFNLLEIKNRLKDENHTWLLICVDFGRADKRVFLFRDMEYINKRKTEKDSILKKEFESRRNYVKIKKQLIDFNELLSQPKEWEYEK